MKRLLLIALIFPLASYAIELPAELGQANERITCLKDRAVKCATNCVTMSDSKEDKEKQKKCIDKCKQGAEETCNKQMKEKSNGADNNAHQTSEPSATVDTNSKQVSEPNE